MGTSANERIALQIDTRADLTGVREARAETGALGAAVQQSTEKITLSHEQAAAAAKEAGGDFERLRQILARMVQQEGALATAASQATTQLQRQARATAGAVQLGPNFAAVSSGRQFGPAAGPDIAGPQLGPAVPGLTTAAAAAASAKVQFDKIPPAARQAGNSLGLLAAAAATGQGSLSGMAVAAGNVAQGMSILSTNAKFAASAAGVGALIASIGILIGVSVEAYRALKEIPEGVLGGTTREHIDNLKTVAQVNREIALAEGRRAALAEQLGRGDTAALQQNVNLGAQIEALYKRRVALVGELREAAKRAAKEDEAEAKKIADKKKSDNEYILGLSAAAAAAQIALTENEFQRRRELLENEITSEKQAADARKLSDDDRLAAMAEINRRREYGLQLIQREADLAKKKIIDEGLAGYAKLSAAVRNHGTLVGAIAKASADAVRLHEIYVEGKLAAIMAKKEGAAALAAFGSGNFGGGALHLAAAAGYGAAAVAAGAEAAGVISGGGGGGSSTGGSFGDSTTFQPRDGNGSGAQVINLYTVNPYTREAMGVLSYELNRGGILKRPIPISPTTGLLGAA
jgi:hypothetical protein